MIMLGGLVMTAILTNTTFESLTRHWLNRTGFAANDLWYMRLERMFTSAFVTAGGKDFWTETMGTVSVQGHLIEFPIEKESSKKLSWSYTGEAIVGPDGVLHIEFKPGIKGEPVVLAYIIIREAR